MNILRNSFRLLLLPVLFAALVWLAYSGYFMEMPQTFAAAITADLLLTLPVIYYLLIRNTTMPRLTVVPMVVAGMVTGFLILPEQHQDYLITFRDYILPLIELIVAGVIFRQVRSALKALKSEESGSPDFYTALRRTIHQKLSGFAAEAVIMELAVLYYSFVAWKRRPVLENEFTYHRKSGGRAVWMIIIFLVIAETVAFHLVLAQWSVTAAWILTGLSAYSGLQVAGIMKSVSRLPISWQGESVHLRYGLMNEMQIDPHQVESIGLFTGNIPDETGVQMLSPLGLLEQPNVLITLKQPLTMRRIYGLKTKVTRIAICLDEPEQFLNRFETWRSLYS